MTPHALSAIAQAFHNVECGDVVTMLPPTRRFRRRKFNRHFLPRSLVAGVAFLAGVLFAALVFVLLSA